MRPQRWREALGAGLLLLAIGLPADSSILYPSLPSGSVRAVRALMVLRICLGLHALLLLGGQWLLSRCQGPGLEAASSGWIDRGPLSALERRALAALVLLGLLARLPGLDGPLWIDEIASLVSYFRLAPTEVLRSYHSANQHLLYSLLGALSLRTFGEQPWVIRLPSLLFGVSGIAALYALGRSIAPRLEASLACALLALSYHQLWFSQSARGYTGMMLAATLGTHLFVRGLTSNSDAVFRGYVACMAAGIACLQNTAFVLLGHLAALLLVVLGRGIRPAGPLLLRGLLAATHATLLAIEAHGLVLPQMLGFFEDVDRAGLGWFGLRELAPVLGGGLVTGFGFLALLALGVCSVAGLASYARGAPLVAAAFVLPALFNVAALALLRYGAYPRSFLYVLPPTLLLFVRGALAVLGRRLGTALVGAVLLASALSLTWNYRHPKQDYPGALLAARAQRRPGEPIAAVGLAAVAYRHFYGPDLAFPESAAQLAALEEGRVWLLYSFPRDMRARFPELFDRVEARYVRVAVFRGTLGDGDLYLCRSR